LGLGGWQPKCHFKVSEEGEHQAKQLEAYSAFLAEKAEEQAGIENNRIFKLKFKRASSKFSTTRKYTSTNSECISMS
jgi:hypothetical protein